MINAIAARVQRLTSRVAALPARKVTWGLVCVFSVWVLLDVFVLHLSGGLSRSTYDAMVRARFHAAGPDPRLVIIDIDEASLARMSGEFGRWPWPRDTLATVLDAIEKQGPAVVVWDVVFSDPDRLNPGGDAAFNEAVKRSTHSHFSVVRLPRYNDAASQINASRLPHLWLKPGAGTATVAVIAPVLPAVAASKLGFNNGYPDADGVLRRYRYLESLSDGGVIQSMAIAVDRSLHDGQLAKASQGMPGGDSLIAWRKSASAYPRVSFADVFAQAEGGRPLSPVPPFAGKIVIVGSTAPSLHDIHPTPLAPTQPGVESLATVIDNTINERQVVELPRWLQAGLAIAMCVGIALWVQEKSVASLDPALFALPATLLGIGYLTLNLDLIFVDLNLSAGLALVFLAALRYWNNLRRTYWCLPPSATGQEILVWPWKRHGPWVDAALDRLIDAVERHAPQCRVIVFDAHYTWPSTLRWPELARYAAIAGPAHALEAARPSLQPALQRLARISAEPERLPAVANVAQQREQIANCAFRAWSGLQKPDTNSEDNESPRKPAP